MHPTTHSTARAAVLVVLVAGCLAVLAGSAAASQWAGEEQHLVERINGERRAAGLAELRVDTELQRVARDWTTVMAREDRLAHNPDLATQVQRDWRLLAENVGWTLSSPGSLAAVDAIHESFMGSSGHRVNVLNPAFDWVGVGVRVTSSGRLWTTVNFMQGAGVVAPPPPLGPAEFSDVTGGTHAPAIKAIALEGITQGCTTDRFCPDHQVTRGQMATFLTRALNLPPATGSSPFLDVGTSTHRDAINALAAAGITGGCGNGRFCPNSPVSRGQMASFLQRGWDLPPSTLQLFFDLGSSVHAPAINAIAAEGITLGCAPARFCPNQAVRRAEMASFLARALDLV